MRPPKSSSVTNLIEAMTREIDGRYYQVQHINVSGTHIQLQGAMQLLIYIITYIPRLLTIDLYYNRIQILSHFKDFWIIERLLSNKSFKNINLRENQICTDWYYDMVQNYI